jgi:hypothetical protein
MNSEQRSGRQLFRWLLALGFCASAVAWGPSALAQERYSRSESLRPIVLPALTWRFDAGASITTQPAGDAQITLPHLGATVGVPGVGIPWRGLEFSANLIDFVVAPSPPAFGYVPQFALTQRIVPTPAIPVTTEIRDGFELAFRVQMGIDPMLGLPFRIEGSLPFAFRAPSFLRIDLAPGVGYQAVYERAVLDVPLRVVLQLAEPFYVAAVSGVSILDLSDTDTTLISLGAQLGLTVGGAFGSLLDFVVDAGFPQFFAPSREPDKVEPGVFRAMLTVRLYTFWDLDATDPDQASGAASRRRRCEGQP